MGCGAEVQGAVRQAAVFEKWKDIANPTINKSRAKLDESRYKDRLVLVTCRLHLGKYYINTYMDELN